jgi:signal transduction histidine kinase
MKFWKDKNLFPVLSVVFLLGLLVLLAGLQYKWLGQISDAERERMQSRLQDDTKRFAEDFNREIQNAYFTLQPAAESFKKNDWSEFNTRYDLWQKEAKYSELVKDLYFVKKDQSQELLHFNKENGRFENAVWTEDLLKIKPKLSDENNFQSIDAENAALLAVIFEDKEDFRQIVVNRNQLLTENIVPAPLNLQNKFGFLIIKLDESVIKNQIFNDLTQKYFAKTDTANFDLAIVDGKNEAVFKTSETPVNSSDASAKLFQITPGSFTFFAKERLPEAGNVKTRQSVVFSQIETKNSHATVETRENKILDVKVMADSKPRVALLERGENFPQGAWTLNVQHSDGSLENFISNTRNRNLAVSFGILTLLAASVVLIFLSAQRSKRLAQRQLDFVSSVSHEFRTPLAVIYSAGENLTDGVVNSQNQVSKYGNLIKGEGKKLTAMVEQILEFAGARSGKRKYDFRQVSIEEIIESALAECQPLIEEKEFVLEKDFAEKLPAIFADSNALSHAIQNLIINSIKYSNGSRWLKISAKNGGGDLKISVEDKGIGVSKKDITHIFEPFYRSKTVVDEQIHGNGLGLSLVKQIVEAHKGKVKVESEIGKGSKFIVHLPLNNGE